MCKKGVVQVCTGEFAGSDGAVRKRMVEVGVWLHDAVAGRQVIKLETVPLPTIGKDGYAAIWLSLKADRGDA